MRFNLTIGGTRSLMSYPGVRETEAVSEKTIDVFYLSFVGTGVWINGQTLPSPRAWLDRHQHDSLGGLGPDTSSCGSSPLIFGANGLKSSKHELIMSSERLDVDHVLAEVNLPEDDLDVELSSQEQTTPLRLRSMTGTHRPKTVRKGHFCFRGQAIAVYGSLTYSASDVNGAYVPRLGWRKSPWLKKNQATSRLESVDDPSSELHYFRTELSDESPCIQAEDRATGLQFLSASVAKDDVDSYRARINTLQLLQKRSSSDSRSASSSLGLLVGLPLALTFILVALLFLYWRTRKNSHKPQSKPSPFLDRSPSTQKGRATRSDTLSLPMQEHRSTLYNSSDDQLTDIKEETLSANPGSEEQGYKLRQAAMRAFRYLDSLPPPTPPPKNIPLPPIPEAASPESTRPPRRTRSWANITPDILSLKTKTSLSTISFTRTKRDSIVPPNSNSRQPFWASIPPMLLSPISPSTPTRIRPLPPLPTSPISPASPSPPPTPNSLRRPLLPNRLGEAIINPNRIDQEPSLTLAKRLDEEADLSPPPYYWHRMLV